MSTTNFATLADRQADLTRRLILDAAIERLEKAGVGELTVRAVAKHACISERTVFRYFPTRELFLDAVADEVGRRLALPGPPRSVDEILAAPRLLYSRFEEKRELTRASRHSELGDRMRAASPVRGRWTAVGRIIDDIAPRRSERERRIAAANIRYYLSAATWQFFRFHFGMSLEETIACAETAIRQTIDGLRKR